MRWARASEGCGEREVGRKKLESEPKQKEANRGGGVVVVVVSVPGVDGGWGTILESLKG